MSAMTTPRSAGIRPSSVVVRGRLHYGRGPARVPDSMPQSGVETICQQPRTRIGRVELSGSPVGVPRRGAMSVDEIGVAEAGVGRGRIGERRDVLAKSTNRVPETVLADQGMAKAVEQSHWGRCGIRF